MINNQYKYSTKNVTDTYSFFSFFFEKIEKMCSVYLTILPYTSMDKCETFPKTAPENALQNELVLIEIKMVQRIHLCRLIVTDDIC